MARTTASKAGALDLLDRLLRSQVLVFFVMDDDERNWLDRLSRLVGARVDSSGLAGLEAERLRHWIYCLLEIYAADDLGGGLERFPGAPVLTEDVPLDVAHRLAAYDRDFFAAAALTLAELTDPPGTLSVATMALPLAEGLADECRRAPPIVRSRLAERAFAFEFPAAPIETLQWLAAIGALVPAKYGRDRNTLPIAENVAVRAASLYEFETIREMVGRLAGPQMPAAVHEDMIRRIHDEAGAQESSKVETELLRLRLAQLKLREASPSARMLGDLRTGLRSPAASRFLAACHGLTPYLRTAVHAQSNTLTDVAAVMIVLQKLWITSDRGLYASKSNKDTIAGDIQAFLRARGFRIDPKTIYRHLQSRIGALLRVQRICREIVTQLGVAFPAHWPDTVHLWEVAIARVGAKDIRLDLAPGEDRSDARQPRTPSDSKALKAFDNGSAQWPHWLLSKYVRPPG